LDYQRKIWREEKVYENLNASTRNSYKRFDKRREYEYLNTAVKICKKGLAKEKNTNIGTMQQKICIIFWQKEDI